MKIITIITILFFLSYSTGYSEEGSNIEKSLIDISNQGASLVHRWLIINDDYSKELICIAYMPDDNKEPSLVVYEKVGDNRLKKISILSLGSFPYLISENNHNLVVVCETAVGYLVQVFGYKNGIVKQLLSDGSYLMPEFIYVGNDYKSSILVPNIEWRKILDSKDEERVPVSANIYIWNGTDYDIYKNVPWNDRVKSIVEKR